VGTESRERRGAAILAMDSNWAGLGGGGRSGANSGGAGQHGG